MYKLKDLLLRRGITLIAKSRGRAADSRELSAAVENWKERRGYAAPGLTLDDLAREFGVRREVLSRHFLSTYGVQFTQWRTALRVEEAKRLLVEQPGATLLHISRTVGISDRRNFTRVFKETTGMTPAAFREKALSAKGTADPYPGQEREERPRRGRTSSGR